MTTTTSPAQVLTEHLVVLSHAGWRIDGWPAMAALDLRWHDHRGTIRIDGPGHAAATSLAGLSRLLPLMAESGWMSTSTGPADGPWRSHVLVHDQHDPVSLLSRWHDQGVASILTSSRMLVPMTHEMLLRRLYTIVSTPTDTAAWVGAAVDTAALLDLVDRSRFRQPPLDLLPRWIVRSARQRLAGALDTDWPSDHPEDVERRLVEFATARP